MLFMIFFSQSSNSFIDMQYVSLSQQHWYYSGNTATMWSQTVMYLSMTDDFL